MKNKDSIEKKAKNEFFSLKKGKYRKYLIELKKNSVQKWLSIYKQEGEGGRRAGGKEKIERKGEEITIKETIGRKKGKRQQSPPSNTNFLCSLFSI